MKRNKKYQRESGESGYFLRFDRQSQNPEAYKVIQFIFLILFEDPK